MTTSRQETLTWFLVIALIAMTVFAGIRTIQYNRTKASLDSIIEAETVVNVMVADRDEVALIANSLDCEMSFLVIQGR